MYGSIGQKFLAFKIVQIILYILMNWKSVYSTIKEMIDVFEKIDNPLTPNTVAQEAARIEKSLRPHISWAKNKI